MFFFNGLKRSGLNPRGSNANPGKLKSDGIPSLSALQLLNIKKVIGHPGP